MTIYAMLAALQHTIKARVQEFDHIPSDRKDVLLSLARYIRNRVKAGQPVRLHFICTHNSRRSHMAQLWAQVAADYYGIPAVTCYSGGTEATAFHPHAVAALRRAGFEIERRGNGNNPIYEVRYANDAPPVRSFSKKVSDAPNPPSDFAAVMTCSQADENCPVVVGSSERIAITYDDPKLFDGTPQEEEKYGERVNQIGRELLFAFSQINSDKSA